jgi:oligoendopeptidase F
MNMRRVVMAGACFAAVVAAAGCASAPPAQPVAEPAAAAPAPAGPPAEATGAAQTVRYEWDLTSLYPSVEAWEAAMAKATADAAALTRYKGTLARSPAAMASALKAVSAVQKDALRAYLYASLQFDEDQRVAEAQARNGRAQQLFQDLQEGTAWIAPELVRMGEAKALGFLKANKELAPFEFMIRDTFRQAPHVLDDKGEGLLASASLALGQPSEIYSLYANASIPWPTVKLSTGEEVKLNQAGYALHRAAPNRDDRKRVFDTFWGAWKQYENGMGATLNAQVLATVFQAQAREYDSALQQALFEDALPPEIYTQLVAQANAALPTFHRYLKLRGRLLGVSDLRYYDIYPPLTQVDAGVFDLKRTEEITFEALRPFGEEYLGLLREGLSQKWMHSHPQEGKRSGAYVNDAAYDVHPFVLLNHNDDYESAATFAHEWGHAVHSMLAQRSQPFETANYSTFTAEMASTINEILLQEHMIANARTRDEKLFYLGQALEQARGTFFRQTMFGEFELAIHEMAERGEPLTGQKMTEIYGALLRKYHGEAEGVMTIDDAYAVEWAFIPHFYMGFYVYQYATSISGAHWFSEQFLAGDTKVRDNFLEVLRAGGSKHPHEILLEEAGLDMTKPDAYQAVVRRMNSIMDRIDALMAEG